MKTASTLLFAILLTGSLAHAQPPDAAAKTAAAAKPAKKTNYSEFTLGLLTWQEDIKATRASESTLMLTQSWGLNLGMNWNNFMQSQSWRNWRWWNTADVTIGQVKGQGNTTGIPDELKRQTFVMLQGSPGLMWRTTPVSELGFSLPIAFRYIKWDLIKAADLKMDKATSFSAGLGLTYVNRFSVRNSIHVTIAHQHMWNTTMWGAGFNRAF